MGVEGGLSRANIVLGAREANGKRRELQTSRTLVAAL